MTTPRSNHNSSKPSERDFSLLNLDYAGILENSMLAFSEFAALQTKIERVAPSDLRRLSVALGDVFDLIQPRPATVPETRSKDGLSISDLCHTISMKIRSYVFGGMEPSPNNNLSLASLILKCQSWLLEQLDAEQVWKPAFEANHLVATTECALNKNKSLMRFREVQKSSHSCMFSRGARLWSPGEWENNMNNEAYLNRSFRDLVVFSRCAVPERLDGFLIEVGNAEFTGTIEALAKCLAHVLSWYAERDPSGINCLKAEIDTADWRYVFNGIPIFITVFAGFYPSSHVRYSPVPGRSYLLFQPLASLDWHGVTADDNSGGKIRNVIRQSFSKNGKPYTPIKQANTGDARRYISGFTSDTHISWWEHLPQPYQSAMKKSIGQ